MKVDARMLIEELQKMHSKAMGWIFIPELRIGTGYGPGKEQRLDAWAINAWTLRSGKNRTSNIRRAFEVKVSRSDVQNELRNPDKRWHAYAVSHEFYFVAPAGLIRLAELDKDDGLIEWTGTDLKIAKPARVRESMPPRWSFVAAIARRVNEVTNGL